MQTGLKLAPRLWRRFIKPRWREVLEAVRTRFPACRFFLHSCGDVRAILPDIVELGFHILHPVQPETPWENVLAFAAEARARLR